VTILPSGAVSVRKTTAIAGTVLIFRAGRCQRRRTAAMCPSLFLETHVSTEWLATRFDAKPTTPKRDDHCQTYDDAFVPMAV
jgi:hypothetical protein